MLRWPCLQTLTAPSLCGGEEMEERDARIGSQHEVLADEKGIEASAAELPEIRMGAQAGFGDGEAVFGNMLDKLERRLHAHGKGFQVAIVDADDASFDGQGTVEFGARMDFNKRFHVEFAAKGDEVAEKRVAESGDDEKKAVGIVGAGFPDLPSIEDEILAEGGQDHFLASLAKILERAAEEFAFGENGESGGASGLERFGECYWVKGIANDSA